MKYRISAQMPDAPEGVFTVREYEGYNAIIENNTLVILGEDGLPQYAWNARDWRTVERLLEPAQ